MHIIIHLRQYIKNTGNLWNEYKLWRNEESPEHKVENLKIKKAQILFACFHPFLVMGWIPKIFMICYLQCENEAKYAMSPNTENIRTSLVYLEYLRKKKLYQISLPIHPKYIHENKGWIYIVQPKIHFKHWGTSFKYKLNSTEINNINQ